MNKPFWSCEELDLDDQLNREIWSDSPAEQDQIHPYSADVGVGFIGAQQAMRHPRRLPWVPDQIGRDWRSPDALFVIGSAYGPFIAGDKRPHEFDAADYDCGSSTEFLIRFLQRVIATRRYYIEIQKLALTVIPSCRLLALVDLCRVAFVRREKLRDLGGDQVVKSAPELFSKFVESRHAAEWLWRRFVESEASAMIALGTVAEHGILRLFSRNLIKASIRDSQDGKICFPAKEGDFRWPSRYAHIRRKLKDRKLSPTPPFWEIKGEVALGVERTWRLAVVPHPTGARGQRSEYPEMAAKTVYDIRAT